MKSNLKNSLSKVFSHLILPKEIQLRAHSQKDVSRHTQHTNIPEDDLIPLVKYVEVTPLYISHFHSPTTICLGQVSAGTQANIKYQWEDKLPVTAFPKHLLDLSHISKAAMAEQPSPWTLSVLHAMLQWPPVQV